MKGLLPGILLCVGIALVANLLQAIESGVAGQPYLEALVLAILLGAIVRAAWTPGPRGSPGIAFCAKTLLEVAVALLGASVSVGAVVAIGPGLLVGIAGVVATAIAASYGIGRAFGLPRKMAILVACGNSICGNSAIVAVARVIEADGDDITCSIAFTAVLGVVVVLGLPLLVPLLRLSLTQYGVLAGLTVYAVPQVLAATLPIGALSNQVGTLVKLVRVLMLGPVVLAMSLLSRRARHDRPGRTPIRDIVPWFILGFLAMAALRAMGAIPEAAVPPLAAFAAMLTTLSMAALGLGVDVGVVVRAGTRVIGAVTLSLVFLGVVSFGLIRLLGIV